MRRPPSPPFPVGVNGRGGRGSPRGYDTPSPEPPPDAVRESSDAANADEPLPLAAYPLERCAAIAASIARNKADKLAILERNELIQAVWAELDRHWQDVVTNENKRGKHRLQDAYDAAWVTQLEDERGALTIVEYAKLLVGTERGSEDTVLAELGVPRAAMAHLRRFWLKKTSKNVAIARALREAVERAREE